MEKVQSFVGVAPEVRAKSLILLAAFVSFVLSVVVWFGGHHQEGSEHPGVALPQVLFTQCGKLRLEACC